jgi:hypothetical protein
MRPGEPDNFARKFRLMVKAGPGAGESRSGPTTACNGPSRHRRKSSTIFPNKRVCPVVFAYFVAHLAYM